MPTGAGGYIGAVLPRAAAHRVIEAPLSIERHTAVPLETRGVVAHFNPASRKLCVHQSTQTPFMMQAVYARLLGLPAHHVRMICPDVGTAGTLELRAATS